MTWAKPSLGPSGSKVKRAPSGSVVGSTKLPFADLPTPSTRCHWFHGHLNVLKKPLDACYQAMFSRANAQGRVGFWMFSWRVVALSHSADVKRVLYAEHHHNLISFIVKHLTMFLGPHNIGMLNDRVWKHERAVVLKSLTAALPQAY